LGFILVALASGCWRDDRSSNAFSLPKSGNGGTSWRKGKIRVNQAQKIKQRLDRGAVLVRVDDLS
jgi:hypothetical protein